jgi:3-oxoacyl-[acyl-carrier-protein] synthase III
VNTYLRGVHYQLPVGVLSNEDLARANPTWDPVQLVRKTGIRQRHIAASGETSADLACQAAEKLLAETQVERSEIDAIAFCTQTPDYLAPASSCLLQHRLGLPTTCAAFDYNLGSSGFTYGLWLARGLILSGSAKNVLLLAGDTLSRECAPGDVTTVPIFGDGAGAALIGRDPRGAIGIIGPTVLGTDGRGGEHFMIWGGGSRHRDSNADRRMCMNGAEIFSFTLRTIQDGIDRLLTSIGMSWDDIDRFLLHQANEFILDKLRLRMGLSPERCPIDLEDIGNTSCASIPVLIRRCVDNGKLRPGHRCVLVGYGGGYSWAMTHLEMTAQATARA